jgi:hypothetical protein
MLPLGAGGVPHRHDNVPAGARRPVRNDLELPHAFDNGLYHKPDDEPKPASQRGAIYGMLARADRDGWPVPMFAVVPDVPYSAAGTFKLLDAHAPMMRELFPRVPLALAVQDGMDPKVATYIARRMSLSWIFVAGSDAWKDSTLYDWVTWGRERGLQVHLARVNERRRLQAAINAGVDSSDGTGIWRGDKKQKQRVLSELVQMLLPVGTVAA